MLSEQEPEDEGVALSGRLFGFLILGVALVFIGIVVLVVVSLFSGSSGNVGLLFLLVHSRSLLDQDPVRVGLS
jgi:uncharacterized membrane protein